MSSTGKSKNLSQRTGYLLSRVTASMQLGFDRGLKVFGVTRSQWNVMAAMNGKDVETAADVAKMLGLDATAVTRLIDRLEDKGLVKRMPDATDRRVNRLGLTEEGQNLFPLLREEADKSNDRVFGALSGSEEEHLKELLTKILRHMSSS